MGNMIPQKSFDTQMHIIRDVHFDVDKYKVGELYVIKHNINNDHTNHFTIDGKMVGKLVEAEPCALTFDIFTKVTPEGILPTDPHNYYGITTITLLLDDIIERQIEIERLLTETEAAVYLMGAISKESAKDIIPEPSNEKPVLADKYKGDLSQFTPLLGIDGYKFPNKELPQQHTKNDDAFDRFMKSEPITVKIESESAADTKVNKRYITFFYGVTNDILINGHINVYAFHLDSYPQFYYVNLKRGETTITMRVSPSKMHFLNDRIIIGDRSCSTKMVLHVDTMCDMFDEIVISDKQ